MNDKSKSLKKSPLAELESQLYEWLCKTTRRGAVISGPLLKSKAKSLYDQIYGKKPNPPSFDTLYVFFFFTFYLVTPLDLVTVFSQTKCVTKSGLHCTWDISI